MVSTTCNICSMLDAFVFRLPLVTTSLLHLFPCRLCRSTLPQAPQAPRLHTSTAGHGWVINQNPNPLICVLALLDHKRRSEGIMEPSAMCRPAGTLTNLSRDRVCPSGQVAPNCSLSEPHLKWDSLQFSCTISLCFICIEALSICKTKSTIHHKYQCSGCHKLRFSLWSPKLFESLPPPS